MNKVETMMYNRYMLGKISLKELLEWHESYKKNKNNEGVKVA